MNFSHFLHLNPHFCFPFSPAGNFLNNLHPISSFQVFFCVAECGWEVLHRSKHNLSVVISLKKMTPPPATVNWRGQTIQCFWNYVHLAYDSVSAH